MTDDPLAIAEELLHSPYPTRRLALAPELARVVKRLVEENARLHELLANDTRRAVLSFKERAEIAEADVRRLTEENARLESLRTTTLERYLPQEFKAALARERERAEQAEAEVSQLHAEYACIQQLLETAGALQDISQRIIEEKDAETHRAEARLRAAEDVVKAATRLLNAIYPAETFIGGSCCEGRTFTCEHDPGVRLVRQLRGALARYDETEAGR